MLVIPFLIGDRSTATIKAASASRQSSRLQVVFIAYTGVCDNTMK